MLKILKRIGYILGYIAAIAVVLALITSSWLVTCGIIKAVTLAFGWAFSFKWATIIWGAITCLIGIWPDKKEVKKDDTASS